jgi:hypothetical protein
VWDWRGNSGLGDPARDKLVIDPDEKSGRDADDPAAHEEGRADSKPGASIATILYLSGAPARATSCPSALWFPSTSLGTGNAMTQAHGATSALEP